ncbi:MAG: hypothetical protein ABSE07_09445 [Methanoregula sp.]
MKLKKLDNYASAAMLLMAAAVTLVAAALVTNLGEFITAAFVISGTACALVGIFILTFTRGETVDPRTVGILTAQWCKNICQIESDLGITGNAYFLPPRITGESRVMQFNPSLTYSGSNVSAKESFTKTGVGGLIITPACEPWIQDLRKRNALVIPDKEEELIILISETIGEIFEFASRVSGSWRDNTFTLTFHGYRFIDGCKAIAHESEEFCTMNPCPVCSLCGALIAEGTDKVVTVDQCSINGSSRDITAVFSMLPIRKVTSPTEQSPTDAAPGSSH